MESPGKKFTDLVEIESIQDTDLAVIRNDTGVKKTPMQKLSDYIKQKFIGWVFSDLPTTDKTIPGALKELNSALGDMALIDDTSISGSTILTMQNSMPTEHLYIAFIRVLHGSNDLLAPWAYLLYIRPENWDYATIGEEQMLVSKVIQNGKLTLTFEDQRWVRMATYRIF